jgi:hypothetical protein
VSTEIFSRSPSRESTSCSRSTATSASPCTAWWASSPIPPCLSEHAGIKAPGARIPGVIQAGTFYKDGAKVFWDVHHGDHAVVIDLADQSYDRLVVEVTDPDATVRLITGALSEQEAAGPEQG